jgi:hypothetical protein
MILCCKSLESVCNGKYIEGEGKIPKELGKDLKKLGIPTDMFKNIVLSTFMSYVHTKSEGPMKVQALLW